MLDPITRRVVTPPLDYIGAGISRIGVGANTVTGVGVLVGMFVIPALAFEAYSIALARASKITDLGGYIDIVGDFLFYSAVPFGFALARPEENGLAATFIIFSFIGTGTSFLTYAVIAAKRGITTEVRGQKSLYYLGGLTEGTETIAYLVLICIFPNHFVLISWIFGAACWITTASRILAAKIEFQS